MSKRYFPVFIDLSQKKTIVIGGGTIATRRVNTLLQFTEKVTVIAPEVTPKLQELISTGLVTWERRSYSSEVCAKQLAEADMVIAATNRPEINLQVKKDCKEAEKKVGHQILVSVIDDKELCDFFFPSIVQSEDIVVGISSGGNSPALTKQVRKSIEKALDMESIYEE